MCSSADVLFLAISQYIKNNIKKTKEDIEETPYRYVMIVDVVQFVHQRALWCYKQKLQTTTTI